MERIYRVARRLTKVAYRIKGIGLGRLCEMIRTSVARSSRGKVILIEDFMGSLKFYCELSEHMGSQIFWRGTYSGGQLKVLERYLRPGATFLDVGANQGEFTVFGASLVGEHGRVIAFEPVSFIRDKLLRNIAANALSNVVVLPFALGAEQGDLPMYGAVSSFADGTEHIGLPTLFQVDRRMQLIERVPVRRLDDVVDELQLREIDLIKLDIEGGEFAALRGAERLLHRYAPKLIFEMSPDICRSAGYEPQELLAWLKQRSYRISFITDDGDLRSVEERHLQTWGNYFACVQDCE
jgi:FkbM family methyltransferase